MFISLDPNFPECSFSFAECEKDLLPYLLHGKDEIFAGLDEASADATYITVDNLWNSYPKEEVKPVYSSLFQILLFNM